MTMKLRNCLTFLVLIIVVAAGCDREEPSDDGEKTTGGDQHALKLVIPSYKSTPAVHLVYQVGPVKSAELDALRQPVGNAVYLAIRECSGEFAVDNGAEASVVAVDFELDGGDVTNVKPRKPKIRKEGEPASKAAQKCVADKMSGSSVEFGEGHDFGSRTLSVVAQARLQP